MVRLAHQLAFISSNVRGDMIDAAQFPTLVRRYEVNGVPRAAINERPGFEGACPRDGDHGEVGVDRHQATRVAGLFAAGDVTDGARSRSSSPPRAGAKAALAASAYLSAAKP
jgi:thioredoxin reductase